MESMGREKRFKEAKEKDTAYANSLVLEKAKRKESAGEDHNIHHISKIIISLC